MARMLPFCGSGGRPLLPGVPSDSPSPSPPPHLSKPHSWTPLGFLRTPTPARLSRSGASTAWSPLRLLTPSARVVPPGATRDSPGATKDKGESFRGTSSIFCALTPSRGSPPSLLGPRSHRHGSGQTPSSFAPHPVALRGSRETPSLSTLCRGSDAPAPASTPALASGEGEQQQQQQQQRQQQQQWHETLRQRLRCLRDVMAKARQGQGVDAFIIPAEDAHQCEYRAACFERMHFMSGFTGSAGTAVVTATEARLWTDGRYFLQARQQLPKEWELMKAGLPGTPSVADWLADTLPPGSRVAIDPFLHTAEAEALLRSALEAKGSSLVFLPHNPVDTVWGEQRPAEPLGELWVHPMDFAGRTVADKVASVQGQMREAGAAVLVTSLLDEVAWLLNVRGKDVPHCPVAISYAAVTEEGAHLFIDRRKLSPEVERHLQEAGVDVQPYRSLLPFIASSADLGKTLWMDPSKASAALFAAFYGTLDLSADASAQLAQEQEQQPQLKKKKAKQKQQGKGSKGGKKAKGGAEGKAEAEEGGLGDDEGHPDLEASPALVTLPCPITLQKACKNEAEIAGMRRAHLRDGAALARFWAWLEEEVHPNRGGRTVSEVEVGERLEEFRAQEEGFLETSFDTIAGANSNGAIIHYCAQPLSCDMVDSTTLLLLDSGGQYVDGTTDVTRTAHMGTPSEYQKEAFTRVLQGHIALDLAVFPEGTPGFVLDVLARKSLWRAGLDYRHGTGHGVGACLNVHEGPQGISPRFGNATPLQPGMVLSNEPGYYDDGHFGIRIENLLVVREEHTEFRFGGSTFFGFDRLTMVPIQAKLINMSLLSPEEVKWLDEYHAEVWEKVSPLLQPSDRAWQWLRANTRPMSEQVTCQPSQNSQAAVLGAPVL